MVKYLFIPLYILKKIHFRNRTAMLLITDYISFVSICLFIKIKIIAGVITVLRE